MSSTLATMTEEYDGRTIWFHWATAILVVTQWGSAQIIDLFPRGPLRTDMRSIHIVLGLALGVILIARIVWRMTSGRRLPDADTGIKQLAAKAVHYGLYVLVGAAVALGLALFWIRGDSLFGLFRLSVFDPANADLRESVGDIHGTVANIILAVAGVHAGAALFHRFVLRDGVLERMLPQLR